VARFCRRVFGAANLAAGFWQLVFAGAFWLAGFGRCFWQRKFGGAFLELRFFSVCFGQGFFCRVLGDANFASNFANRANQLLSCSASHHCPPLLNQNKMEDTHHCGLRAVYI